MGQGGHGEYVMAETVADAAAAAGKMGAARAGYQRAIDLARQGKLEEIAARILAREADFEAAMGNSKTARDDAATALSSSRGRGTLVYAGSALSQAGDAREAEAAAQEVVREHPTDTFINAAYVPAIRAAIAINQGNPEKAIELLQAT